MIKRRVFQDADSVARALADDLLAAFELAASTKQATALMLAGGRTPKTAYGLVAASGRSIPANVSLMVSDERWVPPGHADSNRTMMQPMLAAIGANEDRLIMVNTTLPRRDAAADFGRRLDSFLQSGGILSSCYLGLGADGHTASLFTDQDLHASEGVNALDVDRPDGRVGISAAPQIIRQAKRIVFVVTGTDKCAMAEALVRSPLSITAGKVAAGHPCVELWLDFPAAGRVA